MKKKKTKEGVFRMSTGLPVYNHHAAGIDIGDTLHCVAISNSDGGHEVKATTAYTCDLKGIVEYLQINGITTVAMESTGIYWLPLYIMLEEAEIETYLVNAKHVKNVTGRKKDDTDAIWLHKLHTCGLLQKCFQPDNETRLLRDYTRQRKKLIELGAGSVVRMQKALELMNIKVHTVISDILGKTGMRMVKAIVAGERDARVLSLLCDPRIKALPGEILKSLEGIWKEEYLFMLEQALENYEFHQEQIKRCEGKIKEQLLKQIAIISGGDVSLFEKKTKTKAKKNQFDFELSLYLKKMTGVDLAKIPGIGEATALEFISEVGIDMEKWKGYKNFAAWLNVTPNTKISGGKVISNKLMKKNNKAGQYLRQAASSLSKSKSPIGDYYRRMRSRLGGKGAVLATAHKLAKIIYTMLKTKTEYNPDIMITDQEKYRTDKINKLEKQLAHLKKAA